MYLQKVCTYNSAFISCLPAVILQDNECSTSRAAHPITKEYKEGAVSELIVQSRKMKVGAALLGLLPAVSSVLVYSDCRSTLFHSLSL